MKKIVIPRSKDYKAVADKTAIKQGFTSGRCQGKSVYKKKLALKRSLDTEIIR